jgi:hypothetical protein
VIQCEKCVSTDFAKLRAGSVSIFTDGSALYDKNQKAWVAAGFGLAVVEGGDGHEHSGGRARHHHYGPIRIGDEGTEKLTNKQKTLPR